MTGGTHNGPEYCIHGAPMKGECKECTAIHDMMQGGPERYKRGEAVEILTPRVCDVHRARGDNTQALYDAKMKLGPWANVCQDCFDQHCYGLGTGRGQRLIVRPL